MRKIKFLLMASALLLAFGCDKEELPPASPTPNEQTDPDDQTDPNEQTDPDNQTNPDDQTDPNESLTPTEEFTVNGVSFKMAKLDGGTFTMGATPEQGEDVIPNEKPAHQVTLSDYHIGVTEVTRELWNAVMGTSPNSAQEECPARTTANDIVNVFLPKLNELTGKNFTLPTEAQWEFAARGGNKSQGYKYSGSNDLDEVAWHADNSSGELHPVAQKLPNELGLYDMSGNIQELCSDSYTDYSADPQTDPAVRLSASDFIVRGGSYCDTYCRVSFRDRTTEADQVLGFRLALSKTLTLNLESLELEVGDSKTLSVGYNGIVPMEEGLTWSSSEPGVAGVDSKGKITAISSGSTVITAKVSATGQELSCLVKVIDDAIVVNGVPFKMVKVEGGTFTMGGTPEQGKDRLENELPTHQVTLSDYRIGETTVTQELWVAVMGFNPSLSQTGPQRPVVYVTWNEIVNDFLPALNELTGKNFSLPTEAQWEFAARGGNMSQGYKHSGSNDPDEVAWYVDNSSKELKPVAQKLPNELGLYDMSGNVCELCSDWYGPYSADAQTDPTGPAEGRNRVLRSFAYNEIASRISVRTFTNPMGGSWNCGFRLVLNQ